VKASIPGPGAGVMPEQTRPGLSGGIANRIEP
jgi:hypothetical protein